MSKHDLTIDISKDIDSYKQEVIFGFDIRETMFSIASVAIGIVLILLTYKSLGLTASVYVSMPIVSPLAYLGFSYKHGMYYEERHKRKKNKKKIPKELLYDSTETVYDIEKFTSLMEKEDLVKESELSEFEQSVKAMKKMAVYGGIGVVAIIIITVLIKIFLL